MSKEKDVSKRSIDPAAQQMLKVVAESGLEISWDRYEAMQPQCGFGQLGVCCRNCNMGPCRIDPFGTGPRMGVCGATADIIASRNLARKSAAGASAHSDHGRDIVHALLMTARGQTQGYSLKGTDKLYVLAAEHGIKTEGKSANKIGEELAEAVLAEFGRQEGVLKLVARAPEKLRAKWEKNGVTPRGVDREVVSVLHSTNMGGDNDPLHLIMSCVRAGLADGWGGSMYATDLSDVLFGEPVPVRSRVNLGVLDREKVNVVVHGHEPTLSEAIVAASSDPEIVAAAKKVGANGIQLSGICCTANEILMRHGIPIAGNFLHQELAIATGIVDAMVVDIQCIFPGLAEMKKCYHTKLISTSPKAKFEGMEYLKFEEAKAIDSAKRILMEAVDNFKNRDPNRINVPDVSNELVAGFTAEGIFRHLGGRYRPSYRPLNNAIIDGRIRGVAGVIGCNTVKDPQDQSHLAMVRELLRHDVAVVQTGCSAIACAKYGLLKPESAELWAGYGLKEVCDAVGIPPVLHLGSCVDNSRILMACVEMVREGGLGDDISMLPVAGAAPEWMSEKAIAIGFYVVGSGIFTVLGDPLPVLGSPAVTQILTKDLEQHFGAMFAFEKDPVKAAHLMIEHIDRKRKELGLKKMLNEPRPVETMGKPMSAVAAAEGV